MMDHLADKLDELAGLAKDREATEASRPDQPVAARTPYADARLDRWEEALTDIDALALRLAGTDGR